MLTSFQAKPAFRVGNRLEIGLNVSFVVTVAIFILTLIAMVPAGATRAFELVYAMSWTAIGALAVALLLIIVEKRSSPR